MDSPVSGVRRGGEGSMAAPDGTLGATGHERNEAAPSDRATLKSGVSCAETGVLMEN
jgi:hypothetical protein